LDDLLVHPQFIDQHPQAVVPCKGSVAYASCTRLLDALAPGHPDYGLPANRTRI